MPTYEYECQKCGHHFERFQRMTEAPVKQCPKCRSKVRRLLGTGSGIIFKGSGFYETDYKRPSRKGDSGADEKKSTDAAGPAKSTQPPSEKKKK